jgi:hypothetical protein
MELGTISELQPQPILVPATPEQVAMFSEIASEIEESGNKVGIIDDENGPMSVLYRVDPKKPHVACLEIKSRERVFVNEQNIIVERVCVLNKIKENGKTYFSVLDVDTPLSIDSPDISGLRQKNKPVTLTTLDVDKSGEVQDALFKANSILQEKSSLLNRDIISYPTGQKYDL